MDLGTAVKPHPQGCVICFEIVPGSSRLKVPSGFNSWRRSMQAHLTEEPVRGRANRQLTAELARTLGISESKVEVLSGQRSARKTVLVRDMTREDVVRALERGMEC
jgi:uncharacterized protein (TIGR00251 family)